MLTHNSTTIATQTNFASESMTPLTYTNSTTLKPIVPLPLTPSLQQKDLDATTKHMPARTVATYHAHTQFNNHSDPNQPRKREHDPTHLDQQHHAEADSVLALDASLLQKDLGATTNHMSAGLIALLLTIAATGIERHVCRRVKCLSAASTVFEANYFVI